MEIINHISNAIKDIVKDLCKFVYSLIGVGIYIHLMFQSVLVGTLLSILLFVICVYAILTQHKLYKENKNDKK